MPTPASYTLKQTAYLRKLNRQLRSLAITRGETFTVPQTIEQAKAELARLNRRRPSSYAERAMDRDGLRLGAAALRSSAAVTPSEVTGYGSSARWA
jgi:hypothetical protein